jgi:hypothetical protein
MSGCAQTVTDVSDGVRAVAFDRYVRPAGPALGSPATFEISTPDFETLKLGGAVRRPEVVESVGRAHRDLRR